MRLRRWLWWTGGIAVLVLAVLIIAGYEAARRFEPYLRAKTEEYLKTRFASEVEIGAFRVRLPLDSPLEMAFRKGRGATVKVEVEGILLRYQGRRDIPPILKIRKIHLSVDLPSIWEGPANVLQVRLEGLEVTVPPKGERPKLVGSGSRSPAKSTNAVILQEVVADGSKLVLLPRNPAKPPLEFELHQLKLSFEGIGKPMRYDAALTNAKPPGLIHSQGGFGPWVSEDPAETPLHGDYTFENADLGVFKGISGRLHSTGRFRGRLDELQVDGETRMADFQIKSGGNPMPLTTQFHAVVDGTNGNTMLDPVDVQLKSTRFLARGAVEGNPGKPGRTIGLNVKMKSGRVEDLLLLAVRGTVPPLTGAMDLDMRFDLPPGKGDLGDRLHLAGSFFLQQARFSSREVQENIDRLSRRGQGQPKNQDIEDVPSDFKGRFDLRNGWIDLKDLRFTVPGAAVLLDGRYQFEREEMDFHGKLRLKAKVSQTMSGWKRVVLKPVDSFFAKDGAGVLLRIKITGSRSKPEFGLDREKK